MGKPRRFSIKNLISRMITVIALAVFVYAAYGLFDIFIDYYKNRQLLNDLQETFYDAASAEFDDVEANNNNWQIRPGFDQLLSQNEDVVGWITIDGTQIDYPI